MYQEMSGPLLGSMKRTATVLNLALIPFIALAFLIPAATHEAPEGGYSATDSANAKWRASIPALEVKGDRLPGCNLPVGELADTVAVVRLNGHTERMGFDEAWDRGQNDVKADDVWVVASCKSGR